MKSGDRQFEVGIIGGGPAGSAAAITLARAGRSVLLIEKTDRETFKVGESLPPAITPLLRELGVLERFKSDKHLISYGNESSWGGASLESTGRIPDPNLQGWHVDRPRFDAMLRDAARDAGAQVVEATRVAQCERCDAGNWRLGLDSLDGSSPAQASWLIDCTGRRSWLARREGVKRRAYDNLMAFVALFHESEPADNGDCDSLTLVESVEGGWWYTARVPNGRRVVVYLTDVGTRSANTARYAEGYRALLDETVHIRARLQSHSYAMTGAPMITSSNSSRLERVAGAGWLAAGDAATSFDPLSSQGILTAAYSGLKAGRALDALLSGDFEPLRAYELRIGTVYDAYLNNRVECYRFEQRWQQSEFWRARRQILQAARR
jgi:flavin-dependent dehydrogenase